MQAKELELEVYYRDLRSMCAFSILKLGYQSSINY